MASRSTIVFCVNQIMEEHFRPVLRSQTLSSELAETLIATLAQEIRLRVRTVDCAEQMLLKDAEQDLESAIAEGGLSPAHERMIDAMQKILAYLALQKE